MAADANVINLADYAVMSNDPLVMRITKSLLINGIVLADIPFMDKKTLVANGVRWQDNLPAPTWNRLNGGITVTRGKPTAYQEQAFLLRSAIDIDVKLLEDENQIVDPRVNQLDALIEAISYDWNDKFINNDPLAGDAQAPIGLRFRLNNKAQFGVNTDMLINASGLDISHAGMTAATANQLIEFVQQMLDYFGRRDGDGVVLYMNDYMLRRFEYAIRALGAGAGWSMTKDAFGRALTTYKNARICDIGRKADQTTRIITTTENSDGTSGSSTYTSIYAACYGEDRFVGWQFEPLGNAIKDIGLIGNDGTIARIIIDWAVGLLPMHTRCIARIYGLKLS